MQPNKKNNDKRIESAVAQFYEQRKSDGDRKNLARNIREINQLMKQLKKSERQINLDPQAKIPQVTKYALNLQHMPAVQQMNIGFLERSWLMKQTYSKNRKTAEPKVQVVSEEVEVVKKNVYRSDGHIVLSIEIEENGTLLYTKDGTFPTEGNADKIILQEGQKTISMIIDKRCTLRMVATNFCKAESEMVSMELYPQSTDDIRMDNAMCKHTLRMDLSATGQSDPIFL